MLNRLISQDIQKSCKSILLLGPRQCGKSTLIRSLNPDMTINLVREATFLQFASNPTELEEQIAARQPKTVFIDEIQRLPSLLNTIQAILDEKVYPSLKFFLTGSSARKLKRRLANLLPGRIIRSSLGPLTTLELGKQFDLQRALSEGTLPGIYLDKNRKLAKQTLKSYPGSYLRENVQIEALTRNIEGFSRFIYIAAATAGEYLDLSKLASQAMIPRQSAVRFFEILEDTLLVYRCESFSRSSRTRLIRHPRFFFFDNGIRNALLNNFSISQDRIGKLFEHFLFTQLLHHASALQKEIRIMSFRTSSGSEVDFIVETENRIFAIEIKASKNIHKSDLKGFDTLRRTFNKIPFITLVASLTETPKVIEGIHILPWQQVIHRVFENEGSK